MDSPTVSCHAAILGLEAAQTKVADLRGIALVQKNIGALQVTMSVVYRERERCEKEKENASSDPATNRKTYKTGGDPLCRYAIPLADPHATFLTRTHGQVPLGGTEGTVPEFMDGGTP